MKYSTFIPDTDLVHVVDCYWSVEGLSTEKQKIIPDGFPEIIFHFGQPYKIMVEGGKFQRQGNCLISGQLSKPIVLEATGRSEVFGIKFHADAIWRLFGINMRMLRDRVADLHDIEVRLAELHPHLECLVTEDRIVFMNNFIRSAKNNLSQPGELRHVLKKIDDQRGKITVEELCLTHQIPSRKLQRMFTEQIGITPKQYCRLARFKAVYALVQQPTLDKHDSLFIAGYFDQPHFNKEFREFTSENPEQWFSKSNGFANFFMNR